MNRLSSSLVAAFSSGSWISTEITSDSGVLSTVLPVEDLSPPSLDDLRAAGATADEVDAWILLSFVA